MVRAQRFPHPPAAPNPLMFDLAAWGRPEIPTFGQYSYVRARRQLSEHLHLGCLEICYLREGRQVFRVGERDYALAAGDVFVTFPDEQHGSGRHPMERGALFWLQVRLPRRGERWLGLAPNGALRLAARLRAMPRRCFPGPEEIAGRFRRGFVLLERPESDWRELALANCLVEILLLVLEAAEHSESLPAGGGFNRVLAHIEANLQRPLAVAELAEIADLSTSWFKARFKATVGLSPGDYVQRRKIELAKRWLADPRRPITQLAYDLGFSSSQYFAAVFKKYTQQTPREWRGQILDR